MMNSCNDGLIDRQADSLIDSVWGENDVLVVCVYVCMFSGYNQSTPYVVLVRVGSLLNETKWHLL